MSRLFSCRIFVPSTMTHKHHKTMNGLSNLHHIYKKTGKDQCSLSQPECGSSTNGMIVMSKTIGFAEMIRGFEKGKGMWKPCLKCLNAAYAQGRIGEKTYKLGLEIRGGK